MNAQGKPKKDDTSRKHPPVIDLTMTNAIDRQEGIARVHDGIAQGLGGLWWQANAAVARAKAEHASSSTLEALETVSREALRLLQDAQAAALLLNPDTSARDHIVPALKEEIAAWEAATGVEVQFNVSGEPGDHPVESLARLFSEFLSTLNNLSSEPLQGHCEILVEFGQIEPRVQVLGGPDLFSLQDLDSA